MQKVLLLTLIIFGSNAWADEHEVSGSESIKVCDVKVEKKSMEGIEKCIKGDRLLMTFVRTGRQSQIAEHKLSSYCELNTITILIGSNESTKYVSYSRPYVTLCEYNGKPLEIVR